MVQLDTAGVKTQQWAPQKTAGSIVTVHPTIYARDFQSRNLLELEPFDGFDSMLVPVPNRPKGCPTGIG
jgi:hypothetical protein